MEELQSTEILEKEMLEDARKKAARILKSAQDTINTQNAAWDKKTKDAACDIDQKYNEQIDIETKNIMSRLPIDKQRSKIEKTESLLRDALESWYTGLDRNKKLKLLSDEFIKRFLYCRDQINENSELKIESDGLDQNEAQALIKIINAAIPDSTFNISNSTFNQTEDLTSHSYPSITLDTDSLRIISSIEKTIDHILREKREELINKLIDKSIDTLRTE